MTALPIDRVPRTATAPLLLAFFAAAVAVRVALTQPVGGFRASSSLVFAGVLAAVALTVGARTRLDRRVVAVGVVAAAVLVAPAVALVGIQGALPVADFPLWAAVTAVVASAEEAFLRGVLFDAVAQRRGTDAAIVVGAVAFGLMHVPFYGWGALPLDCAVGAVLGVTRMVAGTWTAPALAHVSADLVGWWTL
jgi:membrane protease YdiL (CAAX protease family)